MNDIVSFNIGESIIKTVVYIIFLNEYNCENDLY